MTTSNDTRIPSRKIMSQTVIVDADCKDDLYCAVDSIMSGAYEYVMTKINPTFAGHWKNPECALTDDVTNYTIDFNHHTLKVEMQLNQDNDLEITASIFEFRYIHPVYLDIKNTHIEYYAIQSVVLNRLMNRVEYHHNEMIYMKEERRLENQEELSELYVRSHNW